MTADVAGAAGDEYSHAVSLARLSGNHPSTATPTGQLRRPRGGGDNQRVFPTTSRSRRGDSRQAALL
jgi:hypothetical protein